MKTPNEVVLGVATEMMYTSMQKVTAETICNWATRLCEAMRQSAETAPNPKRNCNRFSNNEEAWDAYCDYLKDSNVMFLDYEDWLFAEEKGETK